MKEKPSEPVDNNSASERAGVSITSTPPPTDKRLLVMGPPLMLPKKTLTPTRMLPRLGTQQVDDGLLVLSQESTFTRTHLETKSSTCASPPRIVFAPAPSNTQPSVTQLPKQVKRNNFCPPDLSRCINTQCSATRRPTSVEFSKFQEDAKSDQEHAGKVPPISDSGDSAQSALEHLQRIHVPSREEAQSKQRLTKKRKADYIAVENYSRQKKALHKLAMEAITGRINETSASAPIITERAKIPQKSKLDELAEVQCPS